MHRNTPIEQLVEEYEAECCDFSNIEWVIKISRRYVDTMEDSQVRCLLHSLANHLENCREQ